MTGDGLLLVVALILAVLLIVGLAQALRVPKRHSRRIRSRDASRLSQRSPRRAPEAISRSVPPRLDRVPPVTQASPSPPVSEGAPSLLGEVAVPAAEIAPPPRADEPFPPAVPSSAPSEPPEESPGSSERGALPLEDCRRLYETKRYGELLVLAEPHLGQATIGMDTKLGLRRVEAEEFEEALEPLFHALQIDEVDSERQGKTLATVIQALNHVIQDRATRIHQLMVEGKLETAVREGQWLRAVVEEGRELGVREEELAAALALARPIMARLDQAQTGSPP